MPEDAGSYIDGVCIPHSWYPIEAGRNAQIVVTYDAVVYFVAIGSGDYSVKDPGVAIVDAINSIYTRTLKWERFSLTFRQTH